MHTLLTQLSRSYEEEAAKKHLTIHLNLSPSLELLHSSKLYVEEVLQNLITNAVKYTEEGSITIEARQHPSGVEVSIKDTGIGISKSDQEKVFDKFFRSEDYRTRQHNGTGLGLYVTMKLVSLLHAEIRVDSELNKGSTFTVVFPNL
jgi:signal transduction histidine kinase